MGSTGSAGTSVPKSSRQIKLQYSKSYVAFLDVLGFREVTRDKELTEKYFNTCLKAVDILKGASAALSITPLLMSDSIILAIPSKEIKDDLSDIALLIRITQLIQVALLQIGLMTRGGISEGEICINLENGIVVGDGLIKAYELEKLAKNPRVILDPKIPQKLKHTLLTFAKAVNEYSLKHYEINILFTEFDINYIDVGLMPCEGLFVDWFTQILKLPDRQTKVFKRLFEHHSLDDQAQLEKYRWAIRYMAYYSGLIKERDLHPDKLQAKELSNWLQNL